MSCQKEIQEYWNARSGDFSEISREELESPEAGQWIEYFSGILPHPEEGKAVRVLDCGAGAGFYTVLLAGTDAGSLLWITARAWLSR